MAADKTALNGAAAVNGPKVARTLPLVPTTPPMTNPNVACVCRNPGPLVPVLSRNPGRSVLKATSSGANGGMVVVWVVVDEVVDVDVRVVVEIVEAVEVDVVV